MVGASWLVLPSLTHRVSSSQGAALKTLQELDILVGPMDTWTQSSRVLVRSVGKSTCQLDGESTNRCLPKTSQSYQPKFQALNSQCSKLLPKTSQSYQPKFQALNSQCPQLLPKTSQLYQWSQLLLTFGHATQLSHFFGHLQSSVTSALIPRRAI